MPFFSHEPSKSCSGLTSAVPGSCPVCRSLTRRSSRMSFFFHHVLPFFGLAWSSHSTSVRAGLCPVTPLFSVSPPSRSSYIEHCSPYAESSQSRNFVSLGLVSAHVLHFSRNTRQQSGQIIVTSQRLYFYLDFFLQMRIYDTGREKILWKGDFYFGFYLKF